LSASFEEDVVTLLTAQWNSALTGGRTPSIAVAYDDKRVDLRAGDFLRVYNLTELDAVNGFGNNTKKFESVCRIDIRTMASFAQLNLMVTEAKRITDGKRKAGITGYSDLLPTGEAKNLSDGGRQFWRYIYDLRGRKLNVAVTPI